MKYTVKLYTTSGNYQTVGTFDDIDRAATEGWNYAHSKGYTRSACENEKSVHDALITRQFCLLGYGPQSLEIEEVVS